MFVKWTVILKELLQELFLHKTVITLYIWTEADEFSTNILAKMIAMMDQVTLIKTASVNIGCLLGSTWPVSNPLDNFLFMKEKPNSQSSSQQSISLFQLELNVP